VGWLCIVWQVYWKNLRRFFSEPELEQDSIPEHFARLEDKVGQLVDRCQTLERAKADLEAKVRNLEEVVRSKDAAEEQHVEEKTMIKSRIDHLLSRLDQVVDSDESPLKTESFSA